MLFNQMPSEEELLEAVADNNAEYNGRFWYGVKSTGIFCRPGCPSRKPNRENTEFFSSAKNALAAGYRPCKKCHPLHSQDMPEGVKNILQQAEQALFKEWNDGDIREHHIEPDELDQWFKRHHQTRFSHYLQMRRLGLLLGQMEHNNDSTTAGQQLLKNFRKTLSKIIGPSADSDDQPTIYLNRIATPLGLVLAGTDDSGLHLLEFIDRSRHEEQLQKIAEHTGGTFKPGSNEMMNYVAHQLHQYFDGTLKEFSIPVVYSGTDFQQSVWKQLQTIPYGHTRAYQEQAEQIGNEKAVRAVARANGNNRISIIIPCHRVIGKDGSLTGYGGGLRRKKYLLNLEQANA